MQARRRVEVVIGGEIQRGEVARAVVLAAGLQGVVEAEARAVFSAASVSILRESAIDSGCR